MATSYLNTPVLLLAGIVDEPRYQPAAVLFDNTWSCVYQSCGSDAGRRDPL